MRQSCSMISFTLISLLLTVALSDCPIQYYPRQTIVGYINAEISNDPEKHNSQQSYVYNMEKALTTATPNVLVGVNSIEYDMANQLVYNVAYQPTPRFGTLGFKVLAYDQQFKWRRIQFNFIATSNENLIADTVHFKNLPQKNATKETLVSSIQIPEGFRTRPIIQAYISGISLKTKMNKTDFENALKQAQSKKPFSWYLNLVKMVNQIIQIQSQIYYEITNTTLSGNSLSITFSLSESINLRSVSVSYMIVNSQQFPLENKLKNPHFSLSDKVRTYSFSPLQQTDMTFIGMRGLNHIIYSQMNFEFIVNDLSPRSYEISLTSALNPGYSLFVGTIQMESRQQFQCQGCQNSPYRFEDFCLSECPRNYVKVYQGTNSYCKLCNITQFLIPNNDRTECICAKQHFFNKATGVCEPCHYSCLSCQNNRTCSSCDTPDRTTKRTMNQAFQCSCQNGFFDNLETENLFCEKCHSSCATCRGPSFYQCITCQPGREIDETGRCACEGGFRQNSNGECTCEAPSTLLSGVCYNVNAEQGKCKVANQIETRGKNGRTTCVCKDGYFMYNGACVSCPNTYILNTSTGLCECSSTSYLNSQNLCIQCDSLKFYDSSIQKCVCKKQYFQTQNGTCIDCPDKSSYEDGKCKCVFNYYLRNNVCVKCKKTEDDPNCIRIEVSQL